MLAIDTTFAACSAAVRVADNSENQFRQIERFEEMSTGHAEVLMPMVRDVLGEAGLRFKDLEAIAVTVGPGSFTGTRVGIAAARGLALAGRLPVFGTTSLAAIAAEARMQQATEDQPIPQDAIVDVCIDARRGQIYRQIFGNPTEPPMTEPQIMTADAMASPKAHLPGSRVIVGNGAGLVAANGEGLPDILAVLPSFTLPRASALLDIFLERLAPPRPLYLRPPDAKVQVGKSIPRRLTTDEA